MSTITRVITAFPENLYRTIRPGAQALCDGFVYLINPSYPSFQDIDIAAEKNAAKIYGNGDTELKLVDDPFQATKTQKIEKLGTLHIGVYPEALECYQKGLQLLEGIVLQNTSAFFEKGLEDIEKVFFFSHHQMLSYDTDCNPGKIRDKRAKVSSKKKSNEFYPDPEELPQKVAEICKTIQELGSKVLSKQIGAIDAAAKMHQKIVEVQPVNRGNGRLARAWMNVMLQIGGVKAIPFTSRGRYLKAVEGGVGKLKKLIQEMSSKTDIDKKPINDLQYL
ncbi:MAG: hypothetical protein K940chlam6_00094 [Chlamydiae bacterium]|nr:hypothetical protein [Chlamydiota bacterium]